MNYYYNMGYDHKDDSFFAYVDDGAKSTHVVFQIDDCKEMCQYISSGKMNHIDDIEGLETFLKEQQILQPEDSLLLREELIW